MAKTIKKKNALALPHAKGGKPHSVRKNAAKALGAEIGAELSQTSDTHADPEVLNRLWFWSVIELRRNADPNFSHSARLLGRGTAKVAQKFGEEAVECLIEVVAGNRTAAVAESADVLYHLLVMWVEAGIRPEEVWSELEKRESASSMAEGRNGSPIRLSKSIQLGTTKIP